MPSSLRSPLGTSGYRTLVTRLSWGNVSAVRGIHLTRMAAGLRQRCSLAMVTVHSMHDSIKWRVHDEMGIRVRAEVYGLFASALPQSARDEVSRNRRGLVPDFIIALPEAGQTVSDATDEVFELTTRHYGLSAYPAVVT